MLFSRNWLAEYVELPESIDDLARALTDVGLAVETVEESGDDLLLDVDVTTNRPDCMSHYGLAREAAVALGRPLAALDHRVDESGVPTSDQIAVHLDDPEGCPRYVARVVRGVSVGPSPEWLRRRLEAIGARPINNIVDLTNFLLWETGQPLHAFDLDKIGGGEIRVRRARPGESLTTLDGEERELDEEILVIADGAEAVALAGVMGGLDSEVTGETVNVLIEGAHFQPQRVRKAAGALAMHTDACHRFERGADPGACGWVVDRAARLMAEVAGGEIAPGRVDARVDEASPRRGRLEIERLDAFAGVAIAPSQTEGWLRGLGFDLEPTLEPRGWWVTVPSWRLYDFPAGPGGEVYEADIFEEVLRHFGLDNIPSALPAVGGSDAPASPAQRRRERLRDRMWAEGYAEAVNFAFLSAEADAACPALSQVLGLPSEPLELANPLSDRYRWMRRSLVPGLAENGAFNLRRGAPSVRLFEVGTVFHRAGADAELPALETETLALLAGGSLGEPWDGAREIDFFALKGVVERLAETAGVALGYRPAKLPGLVEGTTAEVLLGERPVGYLGQLDADGDVALLVAEIDLAAFAEASAAGPVKLPSRFPNVDADFTLTHALDTPWAEIAAVIEANRPEDLLFFGLKDRYVGRGVPSGAVNTTCHFVYGSRAGSLTQEEVNQRQQALMAHLTERFAWKGEA
ncbi:MAG: phenylalanine--tRNA ligase subunit beta [Acidobacteriota bacterium]